MISLTVLISTVLLSAPNAVDDESVTLRMTESWTGWRGPARTGEAGQYPWPANLAEETLTQTWTFPLAESYSGPIVTRDRVFVTETIDAETESIRALDRRTGEQLWQQQWRGSITVPFFAKRNGSWIRSTPAYSDGILYVGGMEDVLVALRGDDGSIVWKHDFPELWQTKEPTFGFVCSPLVDGEYLYVQVGGAFVKLDKKSGDIVWKTLEDGGGMMGGSFSSPIAATINGQSCLLVQTRDELAAVDKETGSVMWRRKIPSFRGMNILTPTVYENKIFTSNYRGRSYLFSVNGTENSPELEPVWEHKAAAYMSTPVVIDGHAYMHLQNQRVACLNLETGEETWRSSESFGGYWSMVFQGDKIMALDESGELLLMRANPEKLDIIDRRQVGSSSTWAHLAVADNQIFIRELKGLVAYSWK